MGCQIFFEGPTALTFGVNDKSQGFMETFV